MVSVLLAPGASVPTVQTPVPLLYSAAGVADTKDSPAGSTSVTLTPLAVLTPGPALLLVMVSVKVTLAPTTGEALLTLLVNSRSMGSRPASTVLLVSPLARVYGPVLPVAGLASL